jgi:lipopolysaccharide biosynthesis glycosyltransferase
MIDIVIATDLAYLPWAATAIRSVLDHNPSGTVAFSVLHDGDLTRDAIDDLRRLAAEGGATVDVRIVRDARTAALPAAPGGGRITWLRVLLPELLEHLPRALFIDADTFAVTSLDALWSTDLGADVLAAACNVVEPAMHEHVRSIGLSDPRRYLNAGVLLMDLDAMRREDATSAMLLFAEGARDRIRWLDQDTLNVVFENRWRPLHPRWNAMNSLWTWEGWAVETFGAEAVNEARTDPGILHFEGPALCKPWHYLSTHPWREAYRATLRRTPWSGTPLEDRTWSTRALRTLPRGLRTPAYWKLQRRRRRRA